MNKLEEKLPDFSGKCISITIKDDSISHDLYDSHFEMQGGRLFIIGTVPEGSSASNWIANCQYAVAWDRITDYVVFENLESYTKATKISEEYHKDDEEKDEE